MVALAGGFGGGGFAAGVHHDAELVEAVGGGEAGGGEFPEGLLGLRAGEVGDALDVVGEAGSALLEEGADLQGFGLRAAASLVLRRTAGRGRGGASRRTRGRRR